MFLHTVQGLSKEEVKGWYQFQGNTNYFNYFHEMNKYTLRIEMLLQLTLEYVRINCLRKFASLKCEKVGVLKGFRDILAVTCYCRDLA